MHTFLKWLLAALIVLLIIFGVLIYKEKHIPPVTFSKSQIAAKATTTDPVGATTVLHRVPGAIKGTTSASQLQLWATYIEKNAATTTTTISLTGCDPKPPIVSVKSGVELTLVNDDAVDHTMIAGAGVRFVAKAKGSTKIKLTLPADHTYLYTCDAKKPAGALQVR
jgi:hypothetical protein